SMMQQYQLMEKDVVGWWESQFEKKTFPMNEPKEWMSTIHFTKDKMLRVIKQSTQYALSEGIQKAKRDLNRNQFPDLNSHSASRVIQEYASESLDHIEESLKQLVSSKYSEGMDKQDVILAI